MGEAFNRVSPEAWEMVVEHCPKPWPREVAIADLEHHRSATHRGVKFPGRPTLCKRWGWTEWAVRDLVREVDPLGSASRPPAVRQPSASRETVQPTESATIRQPAASPPPAKLHTRDPLLEEPEEDQQPIPPISPPQGELVRLVVAPPPPAPPPTPAPKPDRDAELWTRLMELLVGSGHGQALDLTDDRRRRLRACVKALDGERDGAERLAMLWAWWLLGPNDWWRRTFAGGALLGKLLQPRNVDERALDVPDGWVWDGSFTAAPSQRLAGRASKSSDYVETMRILEAMKEA